MSDEFEDNDEQEPLFSSLEEFQAASGWSDAQIERLRRNMELSELPTPSDTLH